MKNLDIKNIRKSLKTIQKTQKSKKKDILAQDE